MQNNFFKITHKVLSVASSVKIIFIGCLIKNMRGDFGQHPKHNPNSTHIHLHGATAYSNGADAGAASTATEAKEKRVMHYVL